MNISPSGAAGAWLVPLGTGFERQLRLDETRAFNIGRNINNDLVVASCYASSRHARLFAAASKWYVRDLKSKNGVIVNGRRIKGDHRLRGGEKLDIGGAAYRFSIAANPFDATVSLVRPSANRGRVLPPTPRSRKLRIGVSLVVLALITGIGLLSITTLPYFSRSSQNPRPEIISRSEDSELTTTIQRKTIGRTDANLPVSMAHPRSILTNSESSLRCFSMVESKGVFVLDYPSLADLGDAFNRVAILFEEKDMPRDRVVSLEELNTYLQSEGLTPTTFYYGHNYRGRQLARFFNLAAADSLVLSAGEKNLLETLLATGTLSKHGNQYRAVERPTAILGVSQEQEDDPTTIDSELIDLKLRYAILRHELSHGVFFTDPIYRRYVMDFWTRILSEQERAAFRTYLEDSHYNSEDEVMMANEMQAYLVHTPDTRAFRAADLGIDPGRVAELRRRFREDAPPSQLIDAIPPLATLKPQRGAYAKADSLGTVQK